MKLTFAVVFACWTIYSSSRAVLSLPPSLIAGAASLQHQQFHGHGQLKPNFEIPWHKDVAEQHNQQQQQKHVAGNNEGGNIVPDTIIRHNIERPWNSTSTLSKSPKHQRATRMAEISSHYNPQLEMHQKQQFTNIGTDHHRSADPAYDLNGFLQATKTEHDKMARDNIDNNDDNDDNDNDDDDTSPQSLQFVLPLMLPAQEPTSQQQILAQADAANEFFTPLKYWARHCQPDRNCPQQYYRALFANRNSEKAAAAALMHPNGFNMGNKMGLEENIAVPLSHELNRVGNGYSSSSDDDNDNDDNYATEQKNDDNDIFMYLNGEQDIIRFLRWAMQSLYSNTKFANYNNSDGAEHYHPSMYIWKKLNLSGLLEPPLFVEEPRYVLVRREQQLTDDIKKHPRYATNDPFIPPRGRKHNMPDLESLMQRYDTFMPNRGRRDKIRDMLKSTDLFFPNRGKRQKFSMPATMKRDFEYENGRSSSKDTDSVENKSFNTNYNDDNEAHYDGNKVMPLAIGMRDVLKKLLQEKINENKNRNRNENKNEKNNQKTNAAAAAGKKTATKNPNEINYFDDKASSMNNDAEWLKTMLNYKFNGYDPSVKQSMPTAVPINGETREMSTPQKVAATVATATGGISTARSDHALQQLLRQQIQQNSIDDNDNYYGDDDNYGGDNEVDDEAETDIVGIIGVDRGGTKIVTNRFPLTRSMSASIAHHRQQQQKQQQQQLKHRQIEHLKEAMLKDNNWQPIEKDQKQHYRHHHQVKSFTNSEPFLWRQLQLLQHDQHQQQQMPERERQKVSWPQETWISQRDVFDSPYARGYARGTAISGSNVNDYNYADI